MNNQTKEVLRLIIITKLIAFSTLFISTGCSKPSNTVDNEEKLMNEEDIKKLHDAVDFLRNCEASLLVSGDGENLSIVEHVWVSWKFDYDFEHNNIILMKLVSTWESNLISKKINGKKDFSMIDVPVGNISPVLINGSSDLLNLSNNETQSNYTTLRLNTKGNGVKMVSKTEDIKMTATEFISNPILLKHPSNISSPPQPINSDLSMEIHLKNDMLPRVKDALSDILIINGVASKVY